MFDKLASVLPRKKLDWDEFFIAQALMQTARADCTRRQVGSVAVSPEKRIIAAGYNSPPRGVESSVQRFCIENPGCTIPENFGCCKGDGAPANQGYDQCNAIHAEQNCLLEVGSNNHYEYINLYVAGRSGITGKIIDTAPPCIHCSRFIKQFNVGRIVCLQADGSIVDVDSDSLPITAPL